MTLEKMSMKELLALYNRIADKHAGPKTFGTRAKLVARIRQAAAAKNLNLIDPNKPQTIAVATGTAAPRGGAPKVSGTPQTKSGGKGVGYLARAILMDPAGYPHALIAKLVNAQIDGAAATDKSIRWYANDMRKKGVDVPPRGRLHPAMMDEVQSEDAMSTATVVQPAPFED